MPSTTSCACRTLSNLRPDPLAVLLGLIVAASYGAGDFFGGLASRRTPTTSVVVPAHLLGFLLLGLLLVVDPSGHATDRDLVIGAASGVCGGIGVFLLFRGLATGRMSVVAPITAVGAAVLPVAWGLATGERPSALVLFGVLLALAAVALVARSDDPDDDVPADREWAAVGWAVGAGVGFGALFILLAETGDDAGWWPLVSARAASVVAVTVGALVARQQLRPNRPAVPAIAASGVLDVTANAVYLLAVRQGLLSLVAVLSSLYPAGTVLLARVVLKERLVKAQLVGLAFALAGVACIAIG
ncbi:MAG TPA: DMT family transporter [Acidimicrobiales bacterium]|nr:DMT family transporter [Acidimicrobiales bacterium]